MSTFSKVACMQQQHFKLCWGCNWSDSFYAPPTPYLSFRTINGRMGTQLLAKLCDNQALRVPHVRDFKVTTYSLYVRQMLGKRARDKSAQLRNKTVATMELDPNRHECFIMNSQKMLSCSEYISIITGFDGFGPGIIASRQQTNVAIFSTKSLA